MITGSGRVSLLSGGTRLMGRISLLSGGTRLTGRVSLLSGGTRLTSRVSLLSGRTRLTGQIRLRYVGAHPRTAGPRAQGGRLGRAEDSAQKTNSNKKTFFLIKTIL
jgi:hypothetical protein